jgi:hypothetical protein
MNIHLHLRAEGATSYGYELAPWPQEPLLLESCPQERCLPNPWTVGCLAAEHLRSSLRCGGKLAKWTYSYIYRCSGDSGGEDECQSARSDEELQSREC